MRKPLICLSLLTAVLSPPFSTVNAASPPNIKTLPDISLKTKQRTVTGTFNASGKATWVFESKTYAAETTHIEFNAGRTFSASVFANKTDYIKRQAYPYYHAVKDTALIFPFSWSGQQYLELKGTPGATYRLPIYLRSLTPLQPMKTAASTIQSRSLIVKMKQGGSLKQTWTRGAERLSLPFQSGAVVERLRFPSKEAATTALKRLQHSSAVAYAEYDLPVHHSGDTFHRYQWSLTNTGQHNGKKGADIRFSAMQKYIKTKTLAPIRVAVIDTGINSTYADFNGRIRSDLGYDFIRKTKTALDDNGHGSHVAGIIAANGNNAFGISGINPQAQIIPIRVLNARGEGQNSDVIRGILHAVKQGAKVINLSLGLSESSKALEEAIAYAKSKNVLIVAASGNESKSTLNYPARLASVVSVGATTTRDARASFSNYGKGLDLVAPGVMIPSYINDGEIAYSSGTSMAAPHVTAVASLLFSLKPSLNVKQVEAILKQSATDLGAKGYDLSYGFGRLDAYQAVRSVK
ncbi:S8 family peptidase [Exiguobacterium undae]